MGNLNNPNMGAGMAKKTKLSKKELNKASKIAESIKRKQPVAVRSGKINPFAISRSQVRKGRKK